MSLIPTLTTVRVIARDGKFLGDDIGGALVTIRDARTAEILARGNTHGGSGPANLMTNCLTRNQPIPTSDPPSNDACRFDAVLQLDAPRLVEITAYGPLAAPESANTVTATQWIYPGKGIGPASGQEDGFLLEIPGLLVQILNPAAHAILTGFPPTGVIPINANVTMMCGCPIGAAPWPYADFDVTVVISSGSVVQQHAMQFQASLPYQQPSQFAYNWTPGGTGIYGITVYAYQKSTGNTGVAFSTAVLK